MSPTKALPTLPSAARVIHTSARCRRWQQGKGQGHRRGRKRQDMSRRTTKGCRALLRCWIGHCKLPVCCEATGQERVLQASRIQLLCMHGTCSMHATHCPCPRVHHVQDTDTGIMYACFCPSHLAGSNCIAPGNRVSHDIRLEARAEWLRQRLQRQHADLSEQGRHRRGILALLPSSRAPEARRGWQEGKSSPSTAVVTRRSWPWQAALNDAGVQGSALCQPHLFAKLVLAVELNSQFPRHGSLQHGLLQHTHVLSFALPAC